MTDIRKHHGLIRSSTAIYWLRLYQSGDGFLAVVTEVPGNPGSNSMNGHETLLEVLRTDFEVPPDRLTLFEICPSGCLESNTAVARVELGPEPRWIESSVAEIETLVGPIARLPDHEALIREVEQMGGLVKEPIMRHVFDAVRVRELPPPHRPSRCAHYGRFERILKDVPNMGQHWHSRALNAGTLFQESLQPADRQTCPRHQANWRAIADRSVDILHELGPQDDSKDYLRAAGKRLKGKDRVWLSSLFSDPILVSNGGYTNGQHRGCALRFSGAERAAVVVRTEETGNFTSPWTYHGDG